MINIEINTPDVAAGSGSSVVVWRDTTQTPTLCVMIGQFGGRQAASIEYKYPGYSVTIHGGPVLYDACQKIRKGEEVSRETAYTDLFWHTLGTCMTKDNLMNVLKRISEVWVEGRRQGVRDAKQELRMWIHGE